MLYETVLDLETQESFTTLESRDPQSLHLSVIGIYHSQSGEYRAFLEKDLPKLWPIIEHCQRLIGFNILSFDLNVLKKYYHGDLFKIPVLDIYEEVKRLTSFRPSLQALTKATLGKGKSGHGLQAIELYQQGKFKDLIDYCLDDVKITKELYDFGLQNKKLYYLDYLGKKLEIPVDFNLREANPSKINLSLPL